MGKRFDNLKKKAKFAAIKVMAKNLSINVGGPKFLYFTADEIAISYKDKDHLKIPSWGIWHYCHSCDKMEFVHVHDPWSYSSRSYCGNCGKVKSYSSNDLTPTFSFAFWRICSKIAWERYPDNPKCRALHFAKLKFLGLDSEAIPEHRDGKTLEELESFSGLFAMMALLR